MKKTNEENEPIPKITNRYIDCKQCGVTFGCQRQSRQYCSKRCADKAKYERTFVSKKSITGELKPCAYKPCNNMVHNYPRHIRSNLKRFCSIRCTNLSLKTNEPLTCWICKKEFYVSKSQQMLRNRKTCSRACQSKMRETKKVGSAKLRRGMMQKATNLCNKLARLRDCGGKDGGTNCISCNTWYPYAQLDGGHFIPSTSSAIRFDSRNINAQCWRCNRYLSGNSRHYLRGMINKYGDDAVAELEALEFTTKKWTVEELEKLIQETTEQIKEYDNA